jgi:hypothetical protein
MSTTGTTAHLNFQRTGTEGAAVRVPTIVLNARENLIRYLRAAYGLDPLADTPTAIALSSKEHVARAIQ